MFSFTRSNGGLHRVDRFFVGLHISSSVRKLEAALIACGGPRPGELLTLQKSVSFDLPNELVDFYEETLELVRLEQDDDYQKRCSSDEGAELWQFLPKQPSPTKVRKKTGGTSSLARLSLLRTMTTSVQKEAIIELLDDSNLSRDKIVAVAVNDPGIWLVVNGTQPEEYSYSMSDGGLLAAQTGMNIISSFFTNDLSSLGSERSFLMIPYWILLSEHDNARLLIDLGETARWTYIPSNKTRQSWNDSFYQEVIPCGSLLNLFTLQATKGESLIDIGGRLSVQGQRPNELLEFWDQIQRQARDNQKLPPRYYASPQTDVLNELFYFDSIKTAPQKFSSLDALCGSTYWITEQIKKSVDRNVSLFKEPYDIVLTGGAKQNGLLFSRLSDLFGTNAFHNLSELGFLEDSFDAVAVAILAALWATGIPASLPQSNNSKNSYCWGKASPGTPEAWIRLLQFAADNSHS